MYVIVHSFYIDRHNKLYCDIFQIFKVFIQLTTDEMAGGRATRRGGNGDGDEADGERLGCARGDNKARYNVLNL